MAITPMEWLLEDKRPAGYVQTTELRLRAEELGVHYSDVIEPDVRSSWRHLLKKAKSQGLTPVECDRIAELSVVVASKLREAIENRQHRSTGPGREAT